jgi:purine-binding chemotaxis protein CheW
MGEENSPLVSAVITSDTGMTVLLAVDQIIPERRPAIAA